MGAMRLALACCLLAAFPGLARAASLHDSYATVLHAAAEAPSDVKGLPMSSHTDATHTLLYGGLGIGTHVAQVILTGSGNVDDYNSTALFQSFVSVVAPVTSITSQDVALTIEAASVRLTFRVKFVGESDAQALINYLQGTGVLGSAADATRAFGFTVLSAPVITLESSSLPSPPPPPPSPPFTPSPPSSPPPPPSPPNMWARMSETDYIFLAGGIITGILLATCVGWLGPKLITDPTQVKH